MASKHGKKYNEAKEKIGSGVHSPDDAIKLAKEVSKRGFDETVELHISTTAEPRQADQQLREVTNLPHGTGKKVRILVFAEGDALEKAKAAKVDYIGDEANIKKIEEGWDEFEVTLATRSMMPKIAKLGRFLGRKGLMPNPRAGTVVEDSDIEAAIERSKAGRLEIKMDKNAGIHIPIGVASFDEKALLENLATAFSTIAKGKPDGIKGAFVKAAYLTTTMSPSIKLDLGELEKTSTKI